MKWWKKDKKPEKDLKLKEEETEVSFKTPFGGLRRKRTYAAETKTHTPSQATPKLQVFEGTATITPEHYGVFELGEPQRGATISLECREPEGRNFSFLVVDELNMESYRKVGKARKSLMKGTDCDEFNDNAQVSITGRYFLILTTRAVEYKRKVWYHVEIG